LGGSTIASTSITRELSLDHFWYYGFEDYEKGAAYAQSVNKPVLMIVYRLQLVSKKWKAMYGLTIKFYQFCQREIV
jgi:hypothetical protein